MKIARHAQDQIGVGLAQHLGAREPQRYLAQVKLAIEAIGHLNEVRARILALPNRVVPWSRLAGST